MNPFSKGVRDENEAEETRLKRPRFEDRDNGSEGMSRVDGKLFARTLKVQGVCAQDGVRPNATHIRGNG
eukprot:3966866-Amphidinium_carterae.1